jgi:hypothetical protein
LAQPWQDASDRGKFLVGKGKGIGKGKERQQGVEASRQQGSKASSEVKKRRIPCPPPCPPKHRWRVEWVQKWRWRKVRDWPAALNRFTIEFGDRILQNVNK